MVVVADGSLAIVFLIALALPGLILASIGRWARGEGSADRDVGRIIANGFIFSVFLNSNYMFFLGSYLIDGVAAGEEADTLVLVDARKVALLVAILYLAVPALLSLLLNWRHIEWRALRWKVLRPPRSKHGYSATLSAWDYAVRRNQSSWVKVRRANGEWVGGWFSKGSFATAYPEPRSIYIGQQWSLTDDGNFDQDIPGAGVHLTISDEDLVFWLKGQE